MARVRVHNLSMSLDGYVAGPHQRREEGLGDGGEQLHEWMFATRRGRQMFGGSGGDTGVDDDFFAAGMEGIGATVMGRNMFGPIRGPWEDDWRGWWGDDPPYHHPVFVLTHHEREPLPMAGGTIFHFVTEGADAALDRALEAAGGADVRVGGGAVTVQQYLRSGRIDDLHVAVVPILLGGGARLFEDVGTLPGYECVEHVSGSGVTHVRLART